MGIIVKHIYAFKEGLFYFILFTEMIINRSKVSKVVKRKRQKYKNALIESKIEAILGRAHTNKV